MSTDSPASILYDADGNPVTITDASGVVQIQVINMRQIELLEKIVQELKLLNFRIGAVTETGEVTADAFLPDDD